MSELGLPDDLDREAEEFFRGTELSQRLVDTVFRELMTPARELFGDGIVPWIASTLRMTADVLERLDPGGRPPI
jgi:hypothetical protein